MSGSRKAFTGRNYGRESFYTKVIFPHQMDGDVAQGKVRLSLVAHKSEFVAENRRKIIFTGD
jgi:hypothetical protein